MSGDLDNRVMDSYNFAELAEMNPTLYAEILDCVSVYIENPETGLQQMRNLVPEYNKYAQEGGMKPIGYVDANFFIDLLLYIKNNRL